MAKAILESSRGYDAIDLDDELLRNREIFFVDSVDADSMNDLIKKLMYLERQSHDEITIYINSYGGEVISGLAVYDYIRLMKSPIRTVCIGTAASMGAILFISGSPGRRFMLEHTRLLIHDPSYRKDMCGRKSHEIQHELDKLNECRESLAMIIAERTGRNIEEVYKVTRNDTYFTAEDAVEFGLASDIIAEFED